MRPTLHRLSAFLLCCGGLLGAADRPAPDEWQVLTKQIAERPTWDNARLEREALRKDACILAEDRTPLDVVLRRTAALLNHLKGRTDLAAEAAELGKLAARAKAATSDADRRTAFAEVSALRRRIAFRNPLLDFDRLVFLKHNKIVRGDNHMVDQYLGFNAAVGGGVYVLDQPFGKEPKVRDLLAGRTIANGRLAGKPIADQGSFIALDLDYDGKSIAFAWTEAKHEVPADADWSTQRWTQEQAQGLKGNRHYHWRPDNCYHILRAEVDGKDVRQLSDGPYNEYDPCFLPDGRILFVSERCGGGQRCGGRLLPTATLFSMAGDGSDLIQLSWHDTNEWHPSVDNQGMVVYTRWDYVDRDSDVAHHLWRCYPDGRDPRSVHGNYPEVRESRPWMEMSIRAIPNSSRYVAMATPHHGQAYGSMVLIDLDRPDDRKMSQVRRITPEVLFPESEERPGIPYAKGKGGNGQVYGTPWPLDEDFHLAVYDPDGRNYGIYLVDSFGNKELLYRDPKTACLDPMPLRARTRPPAIPAATLQSAASRKGSPMPNTGTVVISNVYESDMPWPKDTTITGLRVVSLFAKPNAFIDRPHIGVAAQSLARGVLGTVPVESDGSAHFTVPAGMAVYFQALDDQGMAVQTMRSDTYLHPGEVLSCIGCHEGKHAAPSTMGHNKPIAMRRPPSVLKPEAEGSFPLTYTRLVQPVLDRNCVPCHQKEKKALKLDGELADKGTGWSRSFVSLKPFAWGMSGGNGTALKEVQYSTPGKVGAYASKLWTKVLSQDHYGTKLSADDKRRLTLWLDCNSVYYGAYEQTGAQNKGELVKPSIGIPPWVDFKTLAR